MCGRYALYGNKKRKPAEALQFHGEDIDFPPRYNLSPMQPLPVCVVDDSGRLRLSLMTWGLVPAWSRNPAIGARLNNARAETVAEKPAFRESWRRRRCLVPMNGFYEWQREGGHRQPYYFSLRGQEVFALAGIHDRWRGPDGETRNTFAVLTTAPNTLMAPVHDRMPVIVPASAYETWLDPRNTTARGLEVLLAPYPADEMQAWPVTARVNSVRNDDAALVEAAGASATIGAVLPEPPRQGLLL